MQEEKKPQEPPDCSCPICKALGHSEELHEVTGLIEIAPNPQAAKGVPRVIECAAGCRFSLEPYFSPRSNGTYSYMLIRSKRNPDAVVNHYWIHPSCIKRG